MINKQTKQTVLERAGFKCEYCFCPLSHSPQPLTVDHIIPVSKNGLDDINNLASACGGCNSYKHKKTHAIDPLSGLNVLLYNPRTMDWYERFMWSIDLTQVIALTDIGRATLSTLRLNRIGLINLREILSERGLHPSK